MNVLESLQWLAMALAGALLAHALLSWVVKSLLWAWAPLATEGTQSLTYERRVYSTADSQLWPIVLMAVGAGLAWGVGLAWLSPASPWLMLLGALGVLAALAMDLQRWERVAVSADSVWFQRGLGQAVHRVSIGSVCDVQVHEFSEPGFTLRHGFRNRSARVSLLLSYRYLTLPKTDAWTGGDAVEKMVNFIVLQLKKMQHESQPLAQEGPSMGPPIRPPMGSAAGSAVESSVAPLSAPILPLLREQPMPVVGAPTGLPPLMANTPLGSSRAVQPLAQWAAAQAPNAAEAPKAAQAVEGSIHTDSRTPSTFTDSPTWWPMIVPPATDPPPEDEALRQSLQRLRDQAQPAAAKIPGSSETSG